MLKRVSERGRFFGLGSVVLLAGCQATQTKYPGVAEFTFDQHELVIGAAERQTVLSGFLLGGDVAEIAVVHIDENDIRHLRIHAFGDGGWAPMLDAALRSGVSFVDVAEVDGRDRLITYAPGGLSWFDPESASEVPLAAVTCDFDPPRRGEVPHVDVTRDVNGDGRDDLVVPDGHGFRVLVQMPGGALADAVAIGPSAGRDRIYGADGYRYDPWGSGRIHEMDYDRDGRGDLVFWNEDHFEVHLQDERGRFAAASSSFTTDVAFDSDEIASLVAPEGVRRRRRDQSPAGDLTGRVLLPFADMNGDGVADLVVFSLEGGSLMHMRSTCEVHFGAPAPDGGTVFAPDIGAAVHTDGIMFGMDRHDLDGDGQVDMMFTIIDPDLFKIVGLLLEAFLTGYVSLDLEFYRMEDGVYPARPNAARKVKSSPGQEAGDKTFFPAVLIGDVNGDGRADLLVGRSQKELRVYLGVPGPELFTRRPRKLAIEMPTDEEYTWLADLNRDDKPDLLMHHPSPSGPDRVTMLIAR